MPLTPRKKALAIAAFAALIVLPIATFYLLSVGAVLGEEFSPDDFTTRSFSYNYLPWAKLTVMGVEHTDTTTAFRRSLLADGWISPSGSATKTWHLVRDSRQPPDSPDYDARFLVEFLEFDTKWRLFNDQHPKKAQVFWPIVAHLARHEMYVYLPEFLQLGLEQTTAPKSDEAFLSAVKLRAATLYSQRAQLQLEQEKWQEARDDATLSGEFAELSEIAAILSIANENLSPQPTSADE